MEQGLRKRLEALPPAARAELRHVLRSPRLRPRRRDRDLLGPSGDSDLAPSVPAVQEQLIVFAREIGELYRLERSRNAELESVNSKLEGQLKAYIRDS